MLNKRRNLSLKSLFLLLGTDPKRPRLFTRHHPSLILLYLCACHSAQMFRFLTCSLENDSLKFQNQLFILKSTQSQLNSPYWKKVILKRRFYTTNINDFFSPKTEIGTPKVQSNNLPEGL